jgi:hypothetical protein
MGQRLETIANPANLVFAREKVRAIAGCAGVDGQSVTSLAADIEHQPGALPTRLLSPSDMCRGRCGGSRSPSQMGLLARWAFPRLATVKSTRPP